MPATRTNSGQPGMVVPARELGAVQKRLADSSYAACDQDAQDAIWNYQRDGGLYINNPPPPDSKAKSV